MRSRLESTQMTPEITKRKTLKRRIPFFGLAAAGVFLSLGIWTLYLKQMGKLYAFQGEQVAAKLSLCKTKQASLTQAEKSREAVREKAEAIRDLMWCRTAWLKRVDAVRKSLFEGMWLTELAPVRDAAGTVTGLRIVGRGWADKHKEIEEKAKSAGRTATAVEELRDRLKTQSVFSGEPQGVRIVGVKDIGAYLIEFTIEATLAASGPKDEAAR